MMQREPGSAFARLRSHRRYQNGSTSCRALTPSVDFDPLALTCRECCLMLVHQEPELAAAWRLVDVGGERKAIAAIPAEHRHSQPR